jgi:hypothetical protein
MQFFNVIKLFSTSLTLLQNKVFLFDDILLMSEFIEKLNIFEILIELQLAKILILLRKNMFVVK